VLIICYSRIRSPTFTDDSTAYYKVGDTWIDINAKEVYVLADSTATAAIWKKVS